MNRESDEKCSDVRIVDNYLLQHVVDIEPSFLVQFNLVQSRLTPAPLRESYADHKVELIAEATAINTDLTTQVKNDAAVLGKELLMQHVRVLCCKFLLSQILAEFTGR